MRTFALPNGTIVTAVDIKAVRVHKHFFRSEKYYVAIEYRNGSTEDAVEHLPRQSADDEQARIIAPSQQPRTRSNPTNMATRPAGRRGVQQVGLKESPQDDPRDTGTVGLTDMMREAFGRRAALRTV
jgi:hypothetical protein